MFEIIHACEQWDNYLSRFSNKVFWGLQYYQLYNQEGTPEAAYYEDERGLVFYPYLRRKIDFEKIGFRHNEEDFFDISTAYGFGGPLIDCDKENEIEGLFSDFRSEFEIFCNNTNIISEFIRFQPFIVNTELMRKFMEVDEKNRNLYVELRSYHTNEDFLNSYKSTNRRRIKKAKELGIKIVIDENKLFLREFVDIYYHTMDRNHADDFYYFSQEYFSQMIHQLGNNCALAHAMYENRIISTELLLYDENCVYSYLGGTYSEYYHLSPNNLLTHEIIMWAKEKGAMYYLLGGGYKPNDGIYYYKKSFAPNHEIDFYVGKKIMNQKLYQELSNHVINQKSTLNKDYFPLYRAT